MNSASHFPVLSVARADIEADRNRAVFSFVLFPLDMHCCSSYDDYYIVTSIMATTVRDERLASGSECFTKPEFAKGLGGAM